MHPFQNKAKVNIHSIKEVRTVPAENPQMEFLYVSVFVVRQIFFFIIWQVNQRDSFSYSINSGL